MDIEFFGANCVRLTTKKASIVIDDTLAQIGGKSITRDADISIHTQDALKAASSKALTLATPGEFEASGVSITGVQARAHTDEPDKMTATMYKFVADDMHILVVGHIYPDLSDAQLEDIGKVDVMIVPVGGNGFTLDPLGALKLIRKVEPAVVVPTQYAIKGMNYEVPALDLEEALKNLTMQPKEVVEKLKAKEVEKNAELSLVVVQSYK
jgi:L-ascorbate metabolism protein UlaG (beta-lactamase superfamily)